MSFRFLSLHPKFVVITTPSYLKHTTISPFPVQQVRFFRSLFLDRKLRSLEAAANENPKNPALQAEYLAELNKVDSRAVIRRYQSHKFSSDEAVLKEYISALIKTKTVDRMSMSQIVNYVRSTSVKGSNASQIHPDFVNAILNEKLHIAISPPKGSGIWKLFRAIAIALLFIGGVVSIAGEERSQIKGTSIHKEFEPTEEKKTFADIHGMDECKSELEDLVQFLRNPKSFTRLGGRLPKGYLIVGPPGTGKTLLAKAVAGEAKVPFLYVSGSDFDEMYVGLGAKRIRSLFATAKTKSPCIIFIDEIDAVGAKRSPHDPGYVRMSLNQLLVEMDGFDQSDGVIIIAATNFPELLDPALVRPGRFDQTIKVDLPDVTGRSEIFSYYTKNIPLGEDVDLEKLSRSCPGLSGADIENIVNTAAVHAAIEKRPNITMKDFHHAQDKILMGPERKTLALPPDVIKLTAYHEGGHALVSYLTEGGKDIRKATILPRGGALGMVSYLENEDQSSLSKRQMLAQIDIAMGGRVAEELIFGEERITSGASSDFRTATQTARAMIMKFGMSPDDVGFATVSKETQKNLSHDHQQKIDMEVHKILKESYDRAKALLKAHENTLHSLADALIKKETLTAGEIAEIIQKTRPKK